MRKFLSKVLAPFFSISPVFRQLNEVMEEAGLEKRDELVRAGLKKMVQRGILDYQYQMKEKNVRLASLHLIALVKGEEVSCFEQLSKEKEVIFLIDLMEPIIGKKSADLLRHTILTALKGEKVNRK